MIDLKKYFTRIGYKGIQDVSPTTLYNIHTAHAFSIPFENLDIHDLANKSDHLIKLSEEALIEKLINKKRGGYCHETNELLTRVLEQMGFKVKRLAARVLVEDSRPFGHQLLVVTINKEKYVADVGFGGNGLIAPIPLKINTEFKQFAETFKLVKLQGEYILQFKVQDKWNPLYSFTLNPYLASDFAPFNYYSSHMHKSIFVTNRICALPTTKGRIILNNLDLKIRNNGKNKTIKITPSEYFKIIKKYFGINLPSDTKFKTIML
ncbi:MAG: nat [Burkholderiales bacterium]|jgi:N-hydroxyarylamine O-acetyltransferase|nr:nat [Burkholderiales bacterium]